MDVAAAQESQPKLAAIDFQTDPSRYKHWRLVFRKEPHFLLGSQHLYARAVLARVESEFLQIHE